MVSWSLVVLGVAVVVGCVAASARSVDDVGHAQQNNHARQGHAAAGHHHQLPSADNVKLVIVVSRLRVQRLFTVFFPFSF